MKTITRGVNTITQRQYTRMKKKSNNNKLKKLMHDWDSYIEPSIIIPRDERTEIKIEPLTPSQISELKGEIKLIKSKRPAVTAIMTQSELIRGVNTTCPEYNSELDNIAEIMNEELPKITRDVLKNHIE